MSTKQRIKVSVQAGIPYKQLLMYVLGAGALGGGAYVGHRYYKKEKKLIKNSKVKESETKESLEVKVLKKHKTRNG